MLLIPFLYLWLYLHSFQRAIRDAFSDTWTFPVVAEIIGNEHVIQIQARGAKDWIATSFIMHLENISSVNWAHSFVLKIEMTHERINWHPRFRVTEPKSWGPIDSLILLIFRFGFRIPWLRRIRRSATQQKNGLAAITIDYSLPIFLERAFVPCGRRGVTKLG